MGNPNTANLAWHMAKVGARSLLPWTYSLGRRKKHQFAHFQYKINFKK